MEVSLESEVAKLVEEGMVMVAVVVEGLQYREYTSDRWSQVRCSHQAFSNPELELAEQQQPKERNLIASRILTISFLAIVRRELADGLIKD